MKDFLLPALEAVGWRDQTGRGPYLDSFGPNGVVFPCGSCDTGGRSLGGAQIRDVMKNDLRGIVFALR